MAGTIDVVQRSFAGLRFSGDTILFAPNLPTGLRAVAFEVPYRGHLLRLHLKDGDMSIASAPGDAGPIKVQVHGIDEVLPPGQTGISRCLPGGPGVVVT
jgi:trehalose/maltose hydrolase-like predicted phosphorylase